MASKGPKTGNPGKLPPAAVSKADAPAPAKPEVVKAETKPEPVVEPAKLEPKIVKAVEPVVPKAVATKAVEAKPVEPKPAAPKPVAKIKPPVAAPVIPEPAPAPVDALPVPPVSLPVEPAPVAAAPAVAPETPTPIVPEPAVILQKEQTIMEATIKTATDKTQAMFGEANDRAKAALEKGTKLFEEMNEFGKGNIEAVVESGKIAAKGFETMGQDAAEYTRKQFEGATAIAKSFASVKSPTELFKLQSDYFRSSFDSLVAESSKTTEAMLKLVGEVAQPLSNRVALAAEKVKLAA